MVAARATKSRSDGHPARPECLSVPGSPLQDAGGGAGKQGKRWSPGGTCAQRRWSADDGAATGGQVTDRRSPQNWWGAPISVRRLTTPRGDVASCHQPLSAAAGDYYGRATAVQWSAGPGEWWAGCWRQVIARGAGAGSLWSGPGLRRLGRAPAGLPRVTAPSRPQGGRARGPRGGAHPPARAQGPPGHGPAARTRHHRPPGANRPGRQTSGRYRPVPAPGKRARPIWHPLGPRHPGTPPPSTAQHLKDHGTRPSAGRTGPRRAGARAEAGGRDPQGTTEPTPMVHPTGKKTIHSGRKSTGTAGVVLCSASGLPTTSVPRL